jgi:citrate lyase beta subunit
MQARRALLYMPGDDLRKIQKASQLGVDCVCMDMEDGVAVSRKPAARETIAEALRTIDFGSSEKLARINAVGSGLEAEDLDTVLPAHPDGIVIPKVESAEQIAWVSAKITAQEHARAWEIGSIGLIVIVESARGIVNLEKIAGADSRLQALIFGAEDLAGDIGATRTPAGWEIFYARSAVLLNAAAFGLQAIDLVFMDLYDLDGLRKEAVTGAQMGFTGKQVIHPNQVGPVQEAFTPDNNAIVQALRVLQAFNEHQSAGRGAFAMDGKMVDMPVIRAAEQVLVRARAAGKVS